MSNNIEFSILMSLYNGEKSHYLDLCFKSISKQTLSASEIILVIDGPVRDELKTVISSWSGILPIKQFQVDKNVGLAKALNIGLKECKFEWVARMDTDDICYPNRFFTQMNFLLNNSNVDICGSNCSVICESGIMYDELLVPQSHESIKRLIWACPMIHPTVFFRKSAILKIGGYSEKLPRRQDDYELWIRAASSGLIFENLPEKLIYYRLATDSRTKNSLSVALNRAQIGFPAVKKFDPRFLSYLALALPLFRCLLPNYLFKKLKPLLRKIDPRRKDRLNS